MDLSLVALCFMPVAENGCGGGLVKAGVVKGQREASCPTLSLVGRVDQY